MVSTYPVPRPQSPRKRGQRVGFCSSCNKFVEIPAVSTPDLRHTAAINP